MTEQIKAASDAERAGGFGFALGMVFSALCYICLPWIFQTCDQMRQNGIEQDASWIRGCHVIGYDRQRYVTKFACPDGSSVDMRSREADAAMKFIAEQAGSR